MQAAVAADPGTIIRSKTLDDSLARAHQLAVAQSHAVVTLEHLLFSLQDDPDSQAILDMSGVGRDKLAADVSSYVGRLSEMMPATPGAAPQPGPDLLRILQLAAMAARQSQRRAIDGAIVLAAIIGDGNSPAAGMLKAQGLTFEAVIKVLSQIGQPRQQDIAPEPQRTSLPAPVAGPPPRASRMADTPSAEDMLASVRERVKKSEPATVAIKTAPKPEPTKAEAKTPAAKTEPVTVEPDKPAPVLEGLAVPAEPPPPDAVAPKESLADVAPPRARTAMPKAPPAAVPDRPGPALAEMRRPSAPTPQQVVPPPQPAAQSAGLPPPIQSNHGPARPPLPPPATPAQAAPPPPRPQPPSSSFVPQPMPLMPPAAMPPPPPASMQPVAGPPSQHTLSPAPPQPMRHPVAQPAIAPQHAQPPPVQQPPAALPPPLLLPAENLNIVAAAAGLPASMRMGTPVLVEVRIPRDQIDVPRRRGPQGVGAGDTPIYRVVSVRLGTGGVSGLAIEPRSPETIWLGMGRDLDQHDFVWQFVVTPTRPGRFAVTLGVSGRTVSPFGVAGDGTPLTETFAVVVKRVPGGRFKRFMSGVVLFALGAVAMAYAGGPLISAVKTLAAKLLK